MSRAWTREGRWECVLTLHAHHSFGMLQHHLLSLIEEAGIPLVGRRCANHWDGSTDRFWLVPRGSLERHWPGGLDEVKRIAWRLHGASLRTASHEVPR